MQNEADFDTEELAAVSAQLGMRVEELPYHETADRVVDYLPPVKKVGEGLVVSVKVPVNDVRLMDEIIHSPDGIFDGQRSDFIRTAIFYLSRVYKTHYRLQHPALVKALNRAILERERAAMEQRIEDLHDWAVSLRNVLCYLVDRDETESAMIELNRWYSRLGPLEGVERDRYLRVICELPICQWVAERMRYWPDRLLPDELLPERDDRGTATVGLTAEDLAAFDDEVLVLGPDWKAALSDTGIPPSLRRFAEEKAVQAAAAKLKRKEYMKDYMAERRAHTRKGSTGNE